MELALLEPLVVHLLLERGGVAVVDRPLQVWRMELQTVWAIPVGLLAQDWPQLR